MSRICSIAFCMKSLVSLSATLYTAKTTCKSPIAGVVIEENKGNVELYCS